MNHTILPERPEQSDYLLEREKTRSGFERAAAHYDASAVLQQEIALRLLERLELIAYTPKRLVDLGCGTGWLAERLLSQYKKTQIIGVDLAWNMVQKTRSRRKWLRSPLGICADVMNLPLQSGSIDLLLSNLMLQWCNDLPNAFQECARVLRPEGVFMFTSFGPDTLQELRQSWAQVDNHSYVSQFVDMHLVGDALLAAGFREPVMDRETITLTYPEVSGLLKDLKGIGANNATAGRRRGLLGKQRLQAFYEAYEQFRQSDGLYPATYEVLYGYAKAPEIMPFEKPERYIPIQPVQYP